MGKVTLKSNEDKALRDKSLLKRNGDEALKGQLHEIFELRFFHQSNLPRPLFLPQNVFKFVFDFAELLKFDF